MEKISSKAMTNRNGRHRQSLEGATVAFSLFLLILSPLSDSLYLNKHLVCMLDARREHLPVE